MTYLKKSEGIHMKWSILLKHKKSVMVLFSFIFLISSAITVYAVDYDALPLSVVEHVRVSTKWSDILNTVGYSILKFIAKLIDSITVSIDMLLSINLYTAVSHIFPYQSVIKPLAWSILATAMIVTAIFLMIKPDMKMKENVRNMLIAMFMIIATPSLFSALQDLKTAGAADMQGVSVVADDSDHSLGEQLLASVVVDLGQSQLYNELRMYSSSPNYINNEISPYTMNINQVFYNEGSGAWDRKLVNIISPPSATRMFDDLTEENMMDLLGMSTEYTALVNARANGTDVEDYGEITGYNNEGIPQYDSYTVYTAHDYERELIRRISVRSDITISASTITAASSLTAALQLIKDTTIRNLNYVENSHITASQSTDPNIVGQYAWADLRTADDVEDLKWYTELKLYLITGGYVVENVYSHDMMFLKGLVLLLTTLICLVFSGIKLAKLIYDIMFMQLISPLVYASDLQQGQRTKKIIQEIIASFIVIIVVLLVFKLYLISVLAFVVPATNLMFQLFLLIAGMQFVIGGPDIVVKLIGLDAGVKNGMAAMIAGQTIARTTMSVGRGAKSLGSSVVSAPGRVFGAMSTGAEKIKTTGSAARNSAMQMKDSAQKIGQSAAGAAKMTKSGAQTGAKLGSALGPVGSAIGGAAGAATGAAAGVLRVGGRTAVETLKNANTARKGASQIHHASQQNKNPAKAAREARQEKLSRPAPPSPASKNEAAASASSSTSSSSAAQRPSSPASGDENPAQATTNQPSANNKAKDSVNPSAAARPATPSSQEAGAVHPAVNAQAEPPVSTGSNESKVTKKEI
ncbi:MAG: hypothetical protein QM689_01635 [Oscillospiraceae bacterium]